MKVTSCCKTPGPFCGSKTQRSILKVGRHHASKRAAGEIQTRWLHGTGRRQGRRSPKQPRPRLFKRSRVKQNEMGGTDAKQSQNANRCGRNVRRQLHIAIRLKMDEVKAGVKFANCDAVRKPIAQLAEQQNVAVRQPSCAGAGVGRVHGHHKSHELMRLEGVLRGQHQRKESLHDICPRNS